MPVDLIGDGGESRPRQIVSFEHWWYQIQVQCHPRRQSGKDLARVAWNAALERAARECGAMQMSGANVAYDAVCRQFQVSE